MESKADHADVLCADGGLVTVAIHHVAEDVVSLGRESGSLNSKTGFHVRLLKGQANVRSTILDVATVEDQLNVRAFRHFGVLSV